MTSLQSNLRINGRPYPIRADGDGSSGWSGWAIEDCDGTACGSEICQHEGSCSVDEEVLEGYKCDCSGDYTGRNCERHALCLGGGGCLNGAECSVQDDKVKCHCPLGFMGPRCAEGEG